MKGLFFFILKLAVLVGVVMLLAAQPGTARIVWHESVVETSAAVLLLAVLALGLVFYALFRIWHFVRHGPQIWRLKRALKKHEEANDYLAQGWTALAGGNAAEAGRLAVAARKQIGESPMTLLLQAQAAHMAHDDRTARSLYRLMAASDDATVLGYRGLIADARRAGDWQEVERLTDALTRRAPDQPWAQMIAFENATRHKAWGDAEDSLAKVAASRLMDSETLRRYRATLALAASHEAAENGNLADALEQAERAARAAPTWLPVLLNLADCQNHTAQYRAARRTAEKAWEQAQHPEAARLLRDLSDDALDGYKRVEKLCRGDGESFASRMALAEAALAADIWGETRRHLIALITRNMATQETYRLMAQLERRENGDERAALSWLTKGADAPLDSAWLCSCGAAHSAWQPVCRACGAFASLEWRRPDEAGSLKGDGAVLLIDGSR